MTNSNSICNKRIRMSDQILKGLIYAAAGIAILILVGVMGYVLVIGCLQHRW